MDFLSAKHLVLSLWKEGNAAYDKVKQEEYKQLYYAVFSRPFSGNEEWASAKGAFLFNGAIAFDRFVGNRPNTVDDESYNMFCRFLTSLQKMDGKHLERTAFLHLEKIQWEIYRKCSLALYDDEIKGFLEQCEKNVKAISLSKENGIVAENIEKKKEEVLGLITAIREGAIRTKIHTTLPYKMTNTNATISLKVDGVAVEVSLSNHSQGSSLPIAKIAEGSTLATSGPSKWTTTTCELDIEAHCLIDGLEERPRITLKNNKEEKGYWTAVFDFTYRMVTAIWTFFQQQEEVTGTWPPLPNDIQYIQYGVCAGDKEYDGEFSTNPSLVYHITSLKKKPKHYEIGEEKELLWSVHTYSYAILYAETGQFKEALFWLNVSVEALIEEFIQRIATSKEMLSKIEGEEHKFDTAEEILSEQYPEMKGKVNWPEIVIHTSVFTKLKRAIKLSGKAVDQKELQKKYALINAKRNNLFHGGSVEIVVDDLEKAFDAYAWLKATLE